MKKNSGSADKRRAARTERRRVMLKQRKAEQRGLRGPVGAGRVEHLGLSEHLLAMVPDPLREEAVQRCFRRIEACETLTELPAGYELEKDLQGTWHVLPPGEPKPLLLKGLMHPARELAIAFAWEIEEGLIDEVGTRELATQIVEDWVSRGALPLSQEPEAAEVRKKLLAVLLAGELLTGYTWIATELAGELAGESDV